MEGQKYRNQLYECEIIGPGNWKATLTYPEALVVFVKDEDKITRIKLEAKGVEEGKELKDLIAEKEKIPTYKKISERRINIGRYPALEVNFHGRWREDAKGDPTFERVIYIETNRYTFILSFYSLQALWNRNEGIFNETLKKFTFREEKTGESSRSPSTHTTTPTTPKTNPKSQSTSSSPSSKTSCTPAYTGRVTEATDDSITINLGSQQCVNKGMTGRVYYEKDISGSVRRIYIAHFKIIATSPHTSNAQVTENTDQITTEHSIQLDK